VRVAALRRGITVYVPTPRLKGGFKRLDPEKIPESDYRKAASLTHMADFAESVALRDLPPFDLVVTGSVAVTRSGKRCGKGRGYGDLEFAILRELGHPPPRVATTIHDLQWVEDFPTERHDLPVSLIVTPGATFEVAAPPPPPSGIDWSLLKPKDLEDMPILAELKALRLLRPVVWTDQPTGPT
jgi:5-formyltetrahydrofolate cyclo-ligase